MHDCVEIVAESLPWLAIATRGGKEAGGEADDGEVPVRQERMVLPSAAILGEACSCWSRASVADFNVR